MKTPHDNRSDPLKTVVDDIDVSRKQASTRSIGAMAGTLLSRCSGVLRTLIVNAYFGINVPLDAFNTAFRFPNSLRDLFADGALSAAFMTTLVVAHDQGKEAERELIAHVLGFFGLVTTAIALLGIIFAAPFLQLISNEAFINSGGYALAIPLFQLLAIYLPLTFLNAVVMAILGVHGYTFRAMNGSIFLSVGMIGGALILAPIAHLLSFPTIDGLAWGALLGAALQFVYQAWPLVGKGLLPWPNLNIFTLCRYPPLREVLRLMLPRVLGHGALTLALLVNTYFALSLGTGVITYVVTTITIIQVPIGLFGVSTAFATLPLLAEAVNSKQLNRFSQLLTEGIDTTMWLAAITTLALILFIVPVYVVIFQHGKVSYYDTLYNGITLCAYASGIIMGTGSKVLLNALYALNAARYIVVNALIYLVINVIFTLWLTPIYGVVGLGFAFGAANMMGYWINYYLVYYVYRQESLGLSPYILGGAGFFEKSILYSIFGFVAALVGTKLIVHFWLIYPQLLNAQLNFASATVILVVVGGAFTVFALLLSHLYGPPQVKGMLRKLGRLKR